MDGEANDPAVWLVVKGEEEVLFGNPWAERGETWGLSKEDEETSMVGRGGRGRGGGKDIRATASLRRRKKHWPVHFEVTENSRKRECSLRWSDG